ncbi:hypothetical protein OG422_18925 [Streptomyces sp. NBC_01525]|uniref:hypothetical protein n=1 Tax=Streptomyces sp. NBC_01525 TaxID=2903893 RepID=UPI00386B0735
MEAYLDFMLIRFGVLAAVVVALALLLLGAAVVLKRRGRLDRARRYADPAARAALRAATRRVTGGPGQGGGRR